MVAELLLLSMTLSDFDPAPYHEWRRFPSLPSLQFAKMQVDYYERRRDLMCKLNVLFPNNIEIENKIELYEKSIWDWSCIVGLQAGNFYFPDDRAESFFFQCRYSRVIREMDTTVDFLDRILAGNFYQGD